MESMEAFVCVMTVPSVISVDESYLYILLLMSIL